MDSVARKVGIGSIVAAFFASLLLFNVTVRPSPAAEARATADGFGSDARIESEVAEAAPRYLAFRATIPSGVHRVAEPGSGSLPALTSDSTGVVEADLFSHYSLAGGRALEPGLYATQFDVSDCGYQLRRVNDDGREVTVGDDHLVKGRVLVTVQELEPDVFESAADCGAWSKWSPLTEPLQEAGSGDYWVGDLLPGQWSVPVDCYWEKVVAFRGADLADVAESGIGPDVIEVEADSLGLRVRGCADSLTWLAPLSESLP